MNDHSMTSKRASRIFALAAAATLLIAACQPAAPVTTGTLPAAETATPAAANSNALPAVLTITIDDAGMTLPAEVATGPVSIEIVNSTGSGGSPIIGRLLDGKTADDLLPALGAAETEGPGAFFEVVTIYGGAEGPAVSNPTLNLLPGSHVALFMGEGMPQTAAFEVVESEAAAAPTAAVEVTTADFTFLMPDRIAAGAQTWHFANNGQQWHETVIYKVEEGQSLDALIEAAAAAGPEGGEGAPEMMAVWTPMSQGKHGWATIDLPAGKYAVICLLPDLLGDMSPHFAHGMVRTLIVQ